MAVIFYNVIFSFHAHFSSIFSSELKHLIIFAFKKNIILSLNKTLNSSYGSAITPASPLETVFVLDYAKFKHSLTT